MNTVIIKPIITEKSMQDAAKNRYTFAVQKTANKAEIARAITIAFGTKPLSVRTIMVKGEIKPVGRKRLKSQETAWKKAIIEYPADKKIELFDISEHQHA